MPKASQGLAAHQAASSAIESSALSKKPKENKEQAAKGLAELQVEELQAVSYEQALQELEQLVQRMERGNLSVEDSLQAYQRGTLLVKHCQQILDHTEAQVQILDGELLKAFPAAESSSNVAPKGEQ